MSIKELARLFRAGNITEVENSIYAIPSKSVHYGMNDLIVSAVASTTTGKRVQVSISTSDWYETLSVFCFDDSRTYQIVRRNLELKEYFS